MVRCDVTMTLIRQEKIGNIFFLKQHTFPQENEYKSLLPKNAHGSPNFDKAACTSGWVEVLGKNHKYTVSYDSIYFIDF